MDTPQVDTDQIRRRKIVRKGFRLCLMVCGRTGLGKTTFVNSLCGRPVLQNNLSPLKPNAKTTGLEIQRHRIEQCETDGTVINLEIVDTPGFGDRIDNSDNSAIISEYLEAQFSARLYEEALVCRNPRVEDHRVDACLYFLPPTGRGLRQLDIEVMFMLSSRVNIIPVIAKADTMSEGELALAKSLIMDDIRERNIPIFSFCHDLDDKESFEENEALQLMLPFSIVSSNEIHIVDDKLVRGRQYPWGLVEIENPLHSDFSVLRSVLFGSHLQELKETTEEIIYEKYRTERLSQEPGLFAKIRREEYQRTHNIYSAEAANQPAGPSKLPMPPIGPVRIHN